MALPKLGAPVPLAVAAAEFVRWLAEVKRYSPHTCAAYGADLHAFIGFLQHHEGREPLVGAFKSLETGTVQAYLAAALKPKGGKGVRAKAPAAKSSLNRQLSALRSFSKWLEAYHDMGNPAVAAMRGLKHVAPKPRALNHSQTWTLLETLAPPPVRPQAVPQAQRRNFALFITLYGLGLRISEALSLTRADVQGNVLTVTGKGRKQRQVPLPLPVQSALNSYMRGSNDQPPEAPLFPSPSKADSPITARMAQKILQETRTKLGLPAHLTPHALRHTFATHLLENGANLRNVQELLGHATLATTQRYLAADTAHLLKVHAKAHPLK